MKTQGASESRGDGGDSSHAGGYRLEFCRVGGMRKSHHALHFLDRLQHHARQPVGQPWRLPGRGRAEPMLDQCYPRHPDARRKLWGLIVSVLLRSGIGKVNNSVSRRGVEIRPECL
jgi:hypothetical protein